MKLKCIGVSIAIATVTQASEEERHHSLPRKIMESYIFFVVVAHAFEMELVPTLHHC